MGDGRGKSLKHEDHARVAWNMLDQVRIVPELVWLRASSLDSDCLGAPCKCQGFLFPLLQLTIASVPMSTQGMRLQEHLRDIII